MKGGEIEFQIAFTAIPVVTVNSHTSEPCFFIQSFSLQNSQPYKQVSIHQLEFSQLLCQGIINSVYVNYIVCKFCFQIIRNRMSTYNLYAYTHVYLYLYLCLCKPIPMYDVTNTFFSLISFRNLVICYLFKYR